MRNGSEMPLWGIAICASLGIHAALAGSLMAIPQTDSKPAAETFVTVQSTPRSLAKKASVTPKAGQTAPPQRAAPIGQKTPLKAVRATPEPVKDTGRTRKQLTAVAVSAVAQQAPATAGRVPPDAQSHAKRAPTQAQRLAAVAATEAARPAQPDFRAAPAATRRVATKTVQPPQPARAASAGAPAPASERLPLPVARQRQHIVAQPSAPSVSVLRPHSTAKAVRPQPPTPVVRSKPQAIASTKGVQRHPVATAPRALTKSDPRIEFDALTPPDPEQTVALLRPGSPEPLAPAETLNQSYAKLLDILSAEPRQCLLALASARGNVIEVKGYAATVERIGELGRRINQLIETPATIHGHLVTDAQCAALTFASDLPAYPEQPLAVQTATPEVRSGEVLTGRIHNFRRSRLYLIIIDDDGKVQELEDLRPEAGNTVSFRAPLTLTDGPVGTVQLLVAIASDHALLTFSAHEGTQAEPYFEQLRNEILKQGNPVDFGVASFIVR
ncbi:hypothetical protein [Allomesorhizobium alhagi]|uniref:hypothetical protein n=1 Tax=Allomesorhizobium alhagi TaxID=475067 RepID=UPI0003054CDF|nr:hypothetical protein [Mesorhizobium alhagi]